MSKKDEMIAELGARAVAFYTKRNLQNMPVPLVEALKKTPVLANYIRNRYAVDTHTVPSFDGIRLNVTRFHSVKGCSWDGKNHVLLMVHGLQAQQAVMWPYLPFFLPLGYDCVTFDLRSVGLSEGKDISTLGANESKDVAEVCKWIRKEYGDDVVLGLFGVSMGAATVLQYSADDPNLGFVIEDCGYANAVDTIREIQQRMLRFIDWEEFYPRVLKYATVDGVTYEDVRPIDSVARLDPEIPLLILHSIPDAVIVIDNADRIFEAKRGKKEIHKYTLAQHSASFSFHPIQYRSDVTGFLEKNGLLNR